MLALNAADVRQALPMTEAIEAMRDAFVALHLGKAALPIRTSIDRERLTMLTMPGAMTDPEHVGAKIITIVPANADRDLPVIQGVIVVFDADTGVPACLLEGRALTAIRTGAASGLATDLLARQGANRLAVLGSGPQAETQVEAVCAVRPITEIAVWSRTREHADRFAARLQRQQESGRVECAVFPSPAAAVEGADIVCTATRATEPVLRGADVEGGMHVNAIGSYTLDMRELDTDLLRGAVVVVDDVAAALAESGEVVRALEAGALRQSDLVTLGSIAAGEKAGREGPDQVTVFKSVGVAVQDLSAAGRAAERARRLEIGTKIDW